MSQFDRLVCGTLVLPGRLVPKGWVAVRNESIAAIGAGERPEARETHDAGSAYVLPGFIDGQTHATSYAGLTGLESTTRSAVAGGVTTLVDMPYDNPEPMSTMAKLAAKSEAVERFAHADVALYGTIVPGQGTAEIARLAEAGVCAFKISSMENNPVRFPRLPADETLAILKASVETGLPVGLHNEDQEIVRGSIAALKARGRTTPQWHEPSRPLAAEMAATALFLELGAATGAHVHIVHFSHPRGFDLVSRYRNEGVNATAELCMHYLHFDNARDIGRLGARMKVSPPIRDGVVDELWGSLERGQVAFVSSDHSSWPIDNKLVASIFDAGAGIPGLETLGRSFYTDLAARGMAEPVRVLADYLSEKPARFFGLWPRKGAIAVGADADLAVLETGDFAYDARRNHDELCWSPYDGERFKARVAATFVRGRPAWDGRTILSRPGQGHFVRRAGA
jgi:allantoinase